MPQSNRQLATIMFTDIVGCKALMDKEEAEAIDLIERNRSTHKEIIEKYNGKFLKEIAKGQAIKAPDGAELEKEQIKLSFSHVLRVR